MGTFTQMALETLLGEYDMSTDHKAVALVLNSESKDDTVYGHTARTSKAGLSSWEATGEGYNDFANDAVDEQLFSRRALDDVLLTIAPLGATVTQAAYFGQAVVGEYAPVGDEVGELLAFRWSASGSGQYGMVRGSVVLNAQPTASGNGSAYQLGAVTATQRIYLGLHFIACNAAITVTLASDNSSGFSSGTTRITAASQAAPGYQFLSVAGAITDDYWRVAYSTSGGAFDIVAVVGIQ